MEEAREEELLVLRRVLGQQKGVKDEPSNPSPTHPITKILTQNLCHLILEEKHTRCGEPLVQTPNSELKAFEKWFKAKLKSPLHPPFKSARGKKRKESLCSRENCLSG